MTDGQTTMTDRVVSGGGGTATNPGSESACAECGHNESSHGSKTRACFVPVASGGAAIGVIWCSCLKYAPAAAVPSNRKANP